MGKTSTEVKRRYNEKTYKRWFADLRNEDFDRILKKVVSLYEKNLAE